MSVIAAQPGELVLSFEYDPATPATWVDMWDNDLVCWLVDESGAAEPIPAVIGKLPPVRTETAPLESPQWVTSWYGGIIAPDLWRGSLDDFFTWLATANGANRRLRGNFMSPAVANAWQVWADRNPERVWPGP